MFIDTLLRNRRGVGEGGIVGIVYYYIENFLEEITIELQTGERKVRWKGK